MKLYNVLDGVHLYHPCECKDVDRGRAYEFGGSVLLVKIDPLIKNTPAFF